MVLAGFPVCAVPKEHIAGRAARFVYDNIVDRDLIVLAEDVASLPEPPKHSQKSQEERAAEVIQKMSSLLGKSEAPSMSGLCVALGCLSSLRLSHAGGHGHIAGTWMSSCGSGCLCMLCSVKNAFDLLTEDFSVSSGLHLQHMWAMQSLLSEGT